MAKGSLLLIRHCDNVLDEKNLFRGYVEEGLSEHGKVEATQVAYWLKGRKIDQLVSCPTLRAKETMLEIAKVNDLPQWRLDNRLITQDLGDLAGKPITEASLDKLLHYQRDMPYAQPPWGGEAYHEFILRWAEGLFFWLDRAQKEDVVAITHHMNGLALPVIFKGMKPTHDSGGFLPGSVMQVWPGGRTKILFTPPQSLELHEKGEL